MNSFFSTARKPKISTVGRAPIIAIALLFLASALLLALPSRDELYALLDRSAMAGYVTVAETTPKRPTVLGEYFDTPSLSPDTQSETNVSDLPHPPIEAERTSF